MSADGSDVEDYSDRLEAAWPLALLPLSNKRMACLLQNVLFMLPQSAFNVPLWSIVGRMTGHGSAYSSRICRELGFDPDQIVRCRRTGTKGGRVTGTKTISLQLLKCPNANPANSSLPS